MGSTAARSAARACRQDRPGRTITTFLLLCQFYSLIVTLIRVCSTLAYILEEPSRYGVVRLSRNALASTVSQNRLVGSLDDVLVRRNIDGEARMKKPVSYFGSTETIEQSSCRFSSSIATLKPCQLRRRADKTIDRKSCAFSQNVGPIEQFALF